MFGRVVTGRWNVSTCEEFKIEDNGNAITLTLAPSKVISSCTGFPSRRHGKLNSEYFDGSLTVGFRAKRSNVFYVKTKVTVEGATSLRIHYDDWPQFNGSRSLGTQAFTYTLTKE